MASGPDQSNELSMLDNNRSDYPQKYLEVLTVQLEFLTIQCLGNAQLCTSKV